VSPSGSRPDSFRYLERGSLFDRHSRNDSTRVDQPHCEGCLKSQDQQPWRYSISPRCRTLLLFDCFRVCLSFPFQNQGRPADFHGSLHTLETEGQLKEACFSTDDRYIFAWTLGRHASNENRWYIWDAWTSVPITNTSSPRVPVSKLGLIYNTVN
jgi:hypothetical protein